MVGEQKHECSSRSTSPTEKCSSRSTSPTEKCSRRSPGVSSTPTKIEHTVSKPSVRTRPLESDAMALSLPVIGNGDVDGKCLRRSTRSASLVTESDSTKVDLWNSGIALECSLMESSDSTEIRRLSGKRKSEGSSRVVGEKCMNSKTVPGHVTEAALSESVDQPASKKVKTCLGKSNSEMVEKKCLIRSPVEVENVKCELLAFPDLLSPEKQDFKKKKSILGKIDLSANEKGLRSRKISSPLRETDDLDVKSALIDLPDVPIDEKTPVKNKISLGISEPHVFSEKCLRSRNITFCSIGGEDKKTRSTLIEWAISRDKRSPLQSKIAASSEKKMRKQRSVAFLIGEPVPDEEAQERWQWRYELKSQRSNGQSWILNTDEEDEVILNVECHYTQAKVGGCVFNIGDCAYIKGKGRQKHIGRILEFFKTMEGEDYFRVQWFFRAEDTVMKEAAAFHDKKRLFYSSLTNDNLLDCIVSKVSVVEIPATIGVESGSIPPSHFYYDMEYCVEYSTFRNLLTDNSVESCNSSSCKYVDNTATTTTPLGNLSRCQTYEAELALLDLYSGCGGMSTGLCLGAKLSGINLVTRWAVDFDRSACDSLKANHPETLVRNEAAEDFLELLKRWEQLCISYVFNDLERKQQSTLKDTGEVDSSINSPLDDKMPTGELEVLCLVDICYGDPSDSGKRGLKFKVRWKGYGPSEDTWEPIEGLSNCKERICDFVRSGSKAKILPLPGDVDVICGGPPCQGISGYNRFRNVDAPLDDERNRQIMIFMDIVKFLKPKFVLMENVVDILRFDKASLGRYALSRLVHMKYQARLGTMAAGCYGIPQFRLRVFLYGALPSEKLPQFPLPTHDVVVRYWPPVEFERNTVAYDEGQPRELEEAVILRDAISDLPAVTSYETREEMAYEMPPETEFQKYIRSTKYEMMGFDSNGVTETKSSVLYDHRPYQLSENNYLRVCQIPHKKGANFRDFPGVVVGDDNVVYRDSTKDPIMLPSGEPMVPGCVFTFEQGKSKRPFARLWWDETVATVVTFPNIRCQAALHPEQDRVMTIREYARLQGFPDFYRFCGTVKERYRQVGNAVTVPVGRALGYALGMSFRKMSGDEPLMVLPPKFSYQLLPIEKSLS